ncbi:MAG: sialidase family protein [Steroidobacteraceae bacterium]|nr:sialidase family protein [Steroidobacteraceae bacterium]
MTDKALWAATRKGTFKIEKSARRWRATLVGHSGVGVNYVARDPNTNRLWALLGHGHWGAKLSISDDDGATWRDNPAQVMYPQGARYIGQDMYEDSAGEFGVAWKTTIRNATLLKLWVIAFGDDGAIWIGTIPGGLFESRDGGASFELNRPLWNHESRGGDLFNGDGAGETEWFGTPASEGGEFAPGIHSIAIDPRNPARILVAVSTAGVIETRDGGRTWRSRNKGMTMDHNPDPEAEWGHDPHVIQLCRGAPDHIWQQNHAGVFYSDNGAESWRKVSAPSVGVHFGFPVTVDARDGKIAWLAPGQSDAQRMAIDGGLFIARTEDGGVTWRQQRKGLPQKDAYDVVYRHALDNCEDVVAFGSTTGNLYVSEDRGESWAVVGHNLPPIYAVRFG